MEKKPKQEPLFYTAAVIVAHPDDETLWTGGVMLMHPETRWTVITLCRKSDPDRSAKFFRALECFQASGNMADLDDGPEQLPIAEHKVQDTILSLLPLDRFDLIITHSIWGEYTRHLRHEETAKAVLALWESGRLRATRAWMFAYEDGGGQHLPRPIKMADEVIRLPDEIWQKKYDIITKIYGFGPETFEARTTPREESFWCLRSSKAGPKKG